MRDQFSKQTKAIDLAIEQMVAVVDRAANEVMTNYLDSLRKRYPNHHFTYVGEMGSRCITVYRKNGTALAHIHACGGEVEHMGYGLYDKNRYTSNPYEEMAQFMYEFECALNQQHYFDADTTDIPKAVDDNHFKEFGNRLSTNFGVNII